MAAYRYAVLGTGALGGFYGARLQRAGLEVHFLLHSGYEAARREGLIVDSVEGDFRLPKINAYRDARDLPPCDVALVALKTTANHLLPELLPPALKPDGVALILQNGLGVEPLAAGIVGEDRVMGGLCFLCSNKTGPNHICHLDYGRVTLGDYASGYRACGVTPRMRQIAEDFGKAGIPVRLAEDLMQARWEKLTWNIPFNGLSVLLNATTDHMMADPGIRGLARELMQETAQAAAATGRCISPEFIEKMLLDTEKMKPYQTSMMLDYAARQPLELQAIFGNPLSAAGIALPRISTLYRQLQFLDRRNRAVAA